MKVVSTISYLSKIRLKLYPNSVVIQDTNLSLVAFYETCSQSQASYVSLNFDTSLATCYDFSHATTILSSTIPPLNAHDLRWDNLLAWYWYN